MNKIEIVQSVGILRAYITAFILHEVWTCCIVRVDIWSNDYLDFAVDIPQWRNGQRKGRGTCRRNMIVQF